MSPTNTTPRRDRAAPPAVGTPYVEVVRGAERGRRFVLSEAQTVIGREDAPISIDDSGVSRRHAKLIVAADRSVMIMDLGSTNKTLVNDTIIELGTLMPGDTISLGPDVLLRFGYDESKPAAQTEAPPEDRASQLSKRQLEVARLVAKGLNNAEVGKALCISANTVARHLENIYGRLGLRSRTALTRWVLDYER